MKIVFFSFPYAGHVFPNIPLLLELLKKKATLIIYGSERYLSNYLAGKGVIFEPYPDYIMDFCKIDTKLDLNSPNAANQYYSYLYDEELICQREYKISELTHLFYENNYEKIKEYRPDLILYDSYSFFANEIISKFKIKSIELNCSTYDPKDITKSKSLREFMSNILINEVENPPSIDKILMINRKIKRLRRKLFYTYGISTTDRSCFSYHCKELQDEAELVSQTNFYLGFDLPNNSIIKKDRTIYVSRGTMSDTYGVHMLEKTLQSFENIDANIIASLGNNKVAGSIINSQTCPSNVEVMLYTNQQECLSRASIFVTHGGITGVREALMNRTPMIVIPANFPDYQIGKALEKSNAGILIQNRPLNKEEIEYKVCEMMNHLDIYTEGVCHIAEQLKRRWMSSGINSLLEEIEI